MGCVESASLEPPGDGKSMLFWPPDELAHQVASTRQNDGHGNKIWFQFRAYQTMINQEAIFNVLLGHTVNQLPYPPDEIAYKFAPMRVTESRACQVLFNQEAIFNVLLGHTVNQLPYPPDEIAYKFAPMRVTESRACQVLFNQEAIFNVLLGHTVNQLPYPPDEIAYKFAGRPRVLEGHACQILVNEKAIFNKLPQVQSFREATQT